MFIDSIPPLLVFELRRFRHAGFSGVPKMSLNRLLTRFSGSGQYQFPVQNWRANAGLIDRTGYDILANDATALLKLRDLWGRGVQDY